MMRFATLSSLLILLTGCALTHKPTNAQAAPLTKLTTAYDYHLLSPSFKPMTLSQLTTAATKADVVFIGEYHGNHASHLLQMQLLARLHQANPKRPLVLSMEQFERHQQLILDDYLKSKIGESYLIKNAPAWNNYKASYRPLVEFAKENDIPVIAANAPKDIVRCVGRVGTGYVDKLTSDKKQTIAKQPFAEIPNYADKFFGVMGLSGHAAAGKRMQQSYQAQLLRDNTMAESINQALQRSPNAQVVHTNGTFHSAQQLGTVSALKRLNPTLNIIVISPIRVYELGEYKEKHRNTGDYHYVMKGQPKAYIDPKNMKAAHQAMFKSADKKAEQCQ
ncbi:hypothetical protein EOL70_03735 [Leucothrix sargassi]|nr:hypothetical protein EOL70_03735 [Leucothrix sargassi]